MSNPLQDPSAQIKKEVVIDSNGTSSMQPITGNALDILNRPAENYTVATGKENQPAVTGTAQSGTISGFGTPGQSYGSVEEKIASLSEVLKATPYQPVDIESLLGVQPTDPQIPTINSSSISRQDILAKATGSILLKK